MKEHAVFEKESTIEQWDNDYYNSASLWLYDRAISDMLDTMGVQSRDTILDAGCGPGVHSIRVAKRGINVCAIDISEAMLRHAKERVQQAAVSDKVHFFQKDLTNLDFPDNSFDYVFSWGVVIHIPDAEKALDELARIIRPGGKLGLYLTNKSAFDHKIESFARFLLRKPLVGLQRSSLGDGIWYENNNEKLWLWRFDADAITTYMSKKGFILKKRKIGELSEIQRRVRGLLRRFLLWLNNYAYKSDVSPKYAATTLFVFEKPKP